MTDTYEQQNTSEKSPEESPSIFKQPEGMDWFLGFLVHLADSGLEAGITLLTGDVIVTGNADRRQDIFEELGGVM